MKKNSFTLLNEAKKLVLEIGKAGFRIDSGPASLLYQLADLQGAKDYCYPSQHYLADLLQCTSRSIRKYVSYLEALSLIKKGKRKNDNGWQNTYSLTLPDIEEFKLELEKYSSSKAIWEQEKNSQGQEKKARAAENLSYNTPINTNKHKEQKKDEAMYATQGFPQMHPAWSASESLSKVFASDPELMPIFAGTEGFEETLLNNVLDFYLWGSFFSRPDIVQEYLYHMLSCERGIEQAHLITKQIREYKAQGKTEDDWWAGI